MNIYKFNQTRANEGIEKEDFILKSPFPNLFLLTLAVIATTLTIITSG